MEEAQSSCQFYFNGAGIRACPLLALVGYLWMYLVGGRDSVAALFWV